MRSHKTSRTSVQARRALSGCSLAALVVAGGLTVASTAGAEEKRPTVSVTNSTMEANTRITGTVTQSIVGSGNTAATILGNRLAGTNVANSTVRANVRVTGAVINSTVGSGNSSTLVLGNDISN